MHYFKRNIGDYHKKAGKLSMLEHGAYTLLLDSCYDREQFPTLELAIEWCWARSDEEIAAIKFILHKFFVLEGDIYIQSRVKEELDNYKTNSLINKEIAIKREEVRRTNRANNNTNRSRTDHEPPPNQEPRTNNHIKNIVDDKTVNCPYSEIIKVYNEILITLPRVKELTSKRKSVLLVRWKENKDRQNIEWWAKLFRFIDKSDFLTGRNGAWMSCSFDWIIKSDNLVKIIEGNYDNK